MEFEIIFKMVKIFLYVILTVAEVLTGDKPDEKEL